MKIRMVGNSVRLRVGRDELARFLADGHIEETVRFAATPDAGFTYSLEVSAPESAAATVRYAPSNLAVVVTPEQVGHWGKEDQVGIYTQVDIGAHEALEIAIEKDFACMHGSESENADSFPNPNRTTDCPIG
jgi:Family of unknown function (DUF7009)